MKKLKVTLDSNQTDDEAASSDNLEDEDKIENQTKCVKVKIRQELEECKT